jgi:hypothetical protein
MHTPARPPEKYVLYRAVTFTGALCANRLNTRASTASSEASGRKADIDGVHNGAAERLPRFSSTREELMSKRKTDARRAVRLRASARRQQGARDPEGGRHRPRNLLLLRAMHGDERGARPRIKPHGDEKGKTAGDARHRAEDGAVRAGAQVRQHGRPDVGQEDRRARVQHRACRLREVDRGSVELERMEQEEATAPPARGEAAAEAAEAAARSRSTAGSGVNSRGEPMLRNTFGKKCADDAGGSASSPRTRRAASTTSTTSSSSSGATSSRSPSSYDWQHLELKKESAVSRGCSRRGCARTHSPRP